MTDTDAQVLVNTTYAAVPPQVVDPDLVYTQIVPEGASLEVLDLAKHREQPARKKGKYTVHDVPSFAAYFGKHAGDNSEIWADTIGHQLVAVLNANNAVDAEWEDHRIQYSVKTTDAWNAWCELDGNLVDQISFAEHIEARSIDLEDPSAAEMLEIAQTFQATTGVEFESGQLLSSGERKLTYKEQTAAKAGQTGHLEIPSEITLLLVPFEGAAPYRVKARFRYRINGGRLALGVVLERPDDIIRAAFLDVVESIEAAVERTVLRGVPS